MYKRKTTILQRISNFFVVISSLSLSLKLVLDGFLSVKLMVMFMSLVVLGAAISSVWIKIIITLSGLAFFLINYVHYDINQFEILVLYVGCLIMMLFGLFVMLGGMRNK